MPLQEDISRTSRTLSVSHSYPYCHQMNTQAHPKADGRVSRKKQILETLSGANNKPKKE